MESNMNLQITRKPSKKTSKRTKPPVKVVYIANPMKIKTSASKFRALVQKLTGRDSDFPDLAKFSVPTATITDTDDDDGGDSTAEIEGRDLGVSNNSSQVVAMSERFEESSGGSSDSSISSGANTVSASAMNTPYDLLDGDDVLLMMEGFSGISPSSVWYETLHTVV